MPDSTNKFDTLADRIRSEAAHAARPGQMERLEAIAEEVEALRRGAKTLGETIEQQCRMVLDATGLHDFIGEDGDGDWGAVWENLYDMCAKGRAAMDTKTCTCGDPTAYSLNPAEVVVHCADGPCYVAAAEGVE